MYPVEIDQRGAIATRMNPGTMAPTMVSRARTMVGSRSKADLVRLQEISYSTATLRNLNIHGKYIHGVHAVPE